MEIKEVIRLINNVNKATEEVKRVVIEMQEQSKILADYAEQIRIETRDEMEKWLEERLPNLFTFERTNEGMKQGYEHYAITNNRINRQHEPIEVDEFNKTLDEVRETFVQTILKVLQDNVGKKILVRVPPTYRLTEEGYHIIRCRLLIEQ